MTDDSYNQQSDGNCTLIVGTAGTPQPTVLLWCEGMGFSKVCPKEGLLCSSHLSKHVFAPCSWGNPAVQHMRSILPIKHELSHVRICLILGSGNTALPDMLQTSCYYNFTAYCQSKIWPYITAFDGSLGMRSGTTQ